MKSEKEFQRAKALAINYLSYRPRSSQEIRMHLAAKAFSSQLIDEVIRHLEEYGYIDDASFALKWYKSRLSRGNYGPFLIGRELSAKGITPHVIRRLHKGLFPEDKERELALRLIKKQGFQKKGDNNLRYKGYQMLIRRGFSPVIAKETVGILDEDMAQEEGM